MAIAKMKKVFITIYKDKLNNITDSLQKLGIIQITNIMDDFEIKTSNIPFTLPKIYNDEMPYQHIDDNILKLQFLLNYLPTIEVNENSLLAKRQGFVPNMIGGKISISHSNFEKEIKSFNFNPIFEECKKLEIESHSLNEEKINTQKLINFLSPWKNLTDDIEKIQNTQKSFVTFMRIQANNIKLFKETLTKELNNEFTFEIIQNEKQEFFSIFISLNSNKEKFDQILKLNSIITVDFLSLNLKGKISNILLNLIAKVQKIEQRKLEIESTKKTLALHIDKISLLYDHFLTIKNSLSIHNNFGHTNHTVTIKGWIKESYQKKLINELEKISPKEISFTFVDPTPDKEDVPIALENNFFVKPYELVIRLYGMPNYNEKDPTPIIAVFFTLIFAIAMSDAVYGILISILSYWLLKKYDFVDEDADIFWLFIFCGIATLVAGAVMGSWCGDLPDRVPQNLIWIKNVKNSLMLFDPLKDLFVFITICLSIGVLHIYTGLLFKAYQNVIKGAVLDAFYDQISWIILVSSLIGWGLAGNNIIPSNYAIYFKYGSEFGALIIILFGARDVKNIFSRIGVGLYKLYGASSYIADILSYTRLLALGLATGIVGMVVNIMALLPADAPLGFVFVTTILIVGHIFNLVINILGAFVHTCRLHYIEFFGKFYDNGGKAFIPFKKEGKYFLIKNL